MLKEIVELKGFSRKAIKALGEKGRDDLVDYVSENPKVGKEVEGLGGIRKIDWNQCGINESEYSVYFHPGHKSLPAVLIRVCKKGEKRVAHKIIEQILHD